PHTVEISAVGPREQISRLKEMDVRVDVARQNELACAIDLFAERCRILFTHCEAFYFVAVDNDRGIRQYFSVGGIDHCPADQRNFFGARGDDADQDKKNRDRFHIPRVVAVLGTSGSTTSSAPLDFWFIGNFEDNFSASMMRRRLRIS